MMWMKLLTSRWTLAGVVLIALSSGVLYYGHTQRVKGEAAGRAIAEEARYQRDIAISALRASQEASEGYANELEDLRSAGKPDPVVRLCPKPKPLSLPGPTARTDGAAPGSGDVQEEPGRDIGPALAREAERADRLAAQLRALQDWIRGVSE